MALEEHPPDIERRRRRSGSRKWRSRILAGLVLAGVIAVSAAYFAAPWLDRRLSRFFEDLIGATLNIPVVIESVQTSPFSQLTLTRLRSVSAAESGKIEFEAREISFYYDPIELLDGRLEKLVLAGPRMFLNLDSNLQGIAQIPDVSPPSGSRKRKSVSESTDNYLPFSITETVIQSGEVILGIAGRSLELKDFKLSLFELGRAHGQSFQLSTQAFGARITARGAFDLTVDDGRIVPRYVFRDASVRVEGLELRRCIDWLRDIELAAENARDERVPETITEVLLNLLETGSGLVTLEGTLDGVWPERVELQLSSNTTGLAAEYSSSLGVTAGKAKMNVRMIVLGRFESMEFDLDAEATGRLRSDTSLTDEAVTVTAKGQYARRDGGTLRLDGLEIDFRDTGRLELHGEIAPLHDDTSPRVDLAIDALALDARRLLELQLVQLPPGTPVALAGDVDMKLRARGPLGRPRLDGTMTLPLVFRAANDHASTFPVIVVAKLEGLEVDSRTLEVRLDSLLLNVDSIDLGATLSYLPRGLGLDRHGVSVNDTPLSAAVEITALEWSASGVSGAVRASAAASGVDFTSEDLWLEVTGVHTRVSLETRLGPAGSELPLELAVDLKLDEFLVGDVQASLEGEHSDLRARGTWSFGSAGGIEKLSLEELTIETPLSGRTRGEGRLERDTASPSRRLDLRLHTTNVPTSRAFRTFVREPLENSAPIIETLELDGRTEVDIEITGPLESLRSSGRWRLSDGTFNAGALTLDGIRLDCPLERRGVDGQSPPVPPTRGHLSIDRIASTAFTIRDLDLPFLHSGGVYTLLEPLAIRLFGGTVDLRALAFALSAGDGPSLKITGAITDLDLEKLTSAYGWIPLQGRLDAAFQPVRYHGGRIEWEGSVDVKAFGGRLRSTNFTIEDLFQPYFSFELRQGVIENVRLQELGTTFNFGLMSSVARGRVEDLEIVGNELAGFRIDFETVPVPGVPRFVNRRAVKSIRRILEGPFGDIEETFFSEFRYDRFGFTAKLDDGTFRLRGKYNEGDHEYIMLARWYQFPRISIINGHPRQAYDWEAIMESLREIYDGTAEDVPGQE